MIAFPSQLPQEWYTDDGPNYAPADNTIRTPMSSGPAKLRRRGTAQIEEVTLSNQLTEAQLAVLEDFVKLKLGEVMRFAWKNFRTGRPATYRFKAGWSSVQSKHFADDVWTVNLTLELMP